MPANQETVAANLAAAITAFDRKRANIIAAAFADGGADRVAEVLKEYTALRDAAFELNRAQLDANNADYKELMTQCDTETDALKATIKRLQSIADVMDTLTKVINLVGRILIVLGV